MWPWMTSFPRAFTPLPTRPLESPPDLMYWFYVHFDTDLLLISLSSKEQTCEDFHGECEQCLPAWWLRLGQRASLESSAHSCYQIQLLMGQKQAGPGHTPSLGAGYFPFPQDPAVLVTRRSIPVLIIWPGLRFHLRPCVGAKLLQSFPTLCKVMECILPGSSVHGIL